MTLVGAGGARAIGPWAAERLADLEALLVDLLPHDRLTLDELQACCFDDPDPTLLLGCDDGSGAVAAVVRRGGGAPTGHIRLLAVAEDHQRQGIGRGLLAAAEDWLATAGAERIVAGGEAPFYLWPGIDVRCTAALSLFEASGYEDRGAVLDLACASTFRRPAPAGVEVRRALADVDVDGVVELVQAHWPWWEPEVWRGIDHGACVAAVVTDAAGSSATQVVAFGCHSVNRGGWIGPLGTDPAHQGGGVGAAILGALCHDVATAGYRQAEIAWIGPVGFYAKTAGAHVSRVFQTRERRLGPP